MYCNLANWRQKLRNSLGSNPVGGTYSEPLDISEPNGSSKDARNGARRFKLTVKLRQILKLGIT